MDSRVMRTRAALQAAVLELSRGESLEAVTIAGICKRAGVNRSTFYKHYQDKETVLADALESQINGLAAGFRMSDHVPDLGQVPPELTAFLEHVAASLSLYRQILGGHGSAVVSARLSQRITTIITDALSRGIPSVRQGIPADVLAEAVAGAAMGMVRAWIAHDPPAPVSTAAHWMWTLLSAQLVSPGS